MKPESPNDAILNVFVEVACARAVIKALRGATLPPAVQEALKEYDRLQALYPTKHAKPK